MAELVQMASDYDVRALFVCRRLNFNTRKRLPNKFFEFVQARLGVVIGPSPEIGPLLVKQCRVRGPSPKTFRQPR